jgi:ferredoxin
LKKSRRSRKSRERKKKGEEKVIGEYVEVVDRGPNRCVLCGRRFKDKDVKIMVGGHFRYAHMECVTSYSFSVID